MGNKTDSLKKVSLPGKSNVYIIQKEDSKSTNKSIPQIITSDIVVSTGSFKIPAESLKVTAPEGQEFKNVQVSLVSAPSTKYASPDNDISMYKERGDGTGAYLGSIGSTPISIPLDTFPNLSVNLGIGLTMTNSIGKHPFVKLTFALSPEAKDTMTVSYNDAPEMMGETVVRNFEGIQAHDKNGDFIQAFEVKLADNKFAGKVGVAITTLTPDIVDGQLMRYLSDTKTYPLGQEGLRYSAKDRFSDMRLVKLDGFPKEDLTNPASSFVKVQVKSCDAYAWGPSQAYHVLATK